MDESDPEEPSWLTDFYDVRTLSEQLQVHPYVSQKMNIPQPNIKWYVYRIWSKSIYEQLEEHNHFQDQFFSKMALGKLFSDPLKEFNISFDHKESFLALVVSVVHQPTTNYGQTNLLIHAVSKRCVDNWDVPEESRRWTVLVYDELAEFFQHTLIPGDLLFIWGGRVETTETNRLVIINHQSSSQAVMSMYRHDGVLEPIKCEEGNFVDPYYRSEEYSMSFHNKSNGKDYLVLEITIKGSAIEQTNDAPQILEHSENNEVSVGVSGLQTKSKRKQESSRTNSSGSLSKVYSESSSEGGDNSSIKASTSSQKNSKTVETELGRECFVKVERLEDL